MSSADRPSWDEWAFGLARAAAVRADCTRRQVGAIIVGPGHRYVVPGYNGLPSGQLGCMDGACPRGRHAPIAATASAGRYPALAADGTLCICGQPHPCPEYVEPYEPYDHGRGLCLSVHAEINALLSSSYDLNKGATMYITAEPCMGCLKIIAGSGIARVKWMENGSVQQLDHPFLSY